MKVFLWTAEHEHPRLYLRPKISTLQEELP
jgi:hypothetical protein